MRPSARASLNATKNSGNAAKLNPSSFALSAAVAAKSQRERPRAVAIDGAAPATRLERQLHLCGLDICDTTLPAAVDWIITRALSETPTTVGFINAHCINVLTRDDGYWRALQGFDRLFADGSGVRIAARLGGFQLADNVNGTDLFPLLCEVAGRRNTKLFLFGGRPGIAEQAAESMSGRIPGLQVAGTHHGYVNSPEVEAAMIARLNSSGAQVLLVGLGVPFQEAWIFRNRSRIAIPCIIGVGGLFDYYSGRIPRAPLALRKAGLEWAWRLAMEPRRLANRYLIGNIAFLTRIIAWRYASPRTFCSAASEIE